jgi:hypothetical protein
MEELELQSENGFQLAFLFWISVMPKSEPRTGSNSMVCMDLGLFGGEAARL